MGGSLLFHVRGTLPKRRKDETGILGAIPAASGKISFKNKDIHFFLFLGNSEFIKEASLSDSLKVEQRKSLGVKPILPLQELF